MLTGFDVVQSFQKHHEWLWIVLTIIFALVAFTIGAAIKRKSISLTSLFVLCATFIMFFNIFQRIHNGKLNMADVNIPQQITAVLLHQYDVSDVSANYLLSSENTTNNIQNTSHNTITTPVYISLTDNQTGENLSCVFENIYQEPDVLQDNRIFHTIFPARTYHIEGYVDCVNEDQQIVYLSGR